MEICHVAAEYAPLIKIGGLADVVFGLSRQLSKLGHTVEVILPFYDLIPKETIKDLSILDQEFYQHRLWRGRVENVHIILIEPLHNDFYKRNVVYGESDDLLRFGSFSLIAYHYLLKKKNNSIVHLHDWHTALIALLNHKKEFPTLYTIHNLAYMGQSDDMLFKTLNISLDLAQSIKIGDHYNLMQAGILYADYITTVSQSYAHEITYTEMGGVLQKSLYKHKEKLAGIINGIDQDFWNPTTDSLLPYHFSEEQLNNKKKIKNYVFERFHLHPSKNFLACSITRLVPQKGPLLILEAIKEVIRRGGSYILVGSASDPTTESQFKELKEALSETQAFHIELVYNEALTHLIFAAADLFVMPSLFEPCGLTQLIALRYGTLPLVRETGGLKDTIIDNKNGFSFKEADEQNVREGIDRALSLWEREPTTWHKMVKEAMQEDHSWERSTQSYLSLYESCLQRI
jgi:starch synthase